MSAAIERFMTAMEAVYGPLDLADADAQHWIPPSDPGAGGHRGRYLWTDAFGVVNFLTLYKETSMPVYLQLAARLIDAVHNVLGYTRAGHERLPGATNGAPLSGGLRIGKLSDSGIDCDGQYHHYLTMWMFALNRMSVASGQVKYNDLAIQLANSIHNHFIVRDTTGDLRMVWKISADMQDTLVPSEGHLDAATGYAIYTLLQHTAVSFVEGADQLLSREIDDYSKLMARPGKLVPTTDFLDLGMGLWMCHLCQGEPWVPKFANTSLAMMERLLEDSYGPAHLGRHKSLAFREFGAYLGVRLFGADEALESKVDSLILTWDLGRGDIDQDLKPISHVMYASALIPGAFRVDCFPGPTAS